MTAASRKAAPEKADREPNGLREAVLPLENPSRTFPAGESPSSAMVRDVDQPADQELVERCQRGDRAAFDLLVPRYQDRIYNVVFRLVNDRHRAEDLAQEAFAQAYRHLDRFKGESSFYTWLYRIAVNLCLSHRRRLSTRMAGRTLSIFRKPDSTFRESTIDLEDRRDEPTRRVDQKEMGRQIQDAISALEGTLRQVVVLRDLEGHSYEDIADLIGCPIGTVRSRLHRARGLLQQRLEHLL